VIEHRVGEPSGKAGLMLKVGRTALAGFVAFAGSALLDNVLKVSLADQLVLTFITGGTALLIQYLVEFEQRLKAFENDERRIIGDLQETIRHGFAGVNEATELREEIESSALNHETLKHVIRRAGYFSELNSPLVLRVADNEVDRLAADLQALASGHELFYDGEDREYLLALTSQSRKSIMATAWTTATSLEAGFWLTDLGVRYLDLQRAALRRGVQIKRVFIVENPDVMRTDLVQRILSTQRTMGVEIRLLGVGPVPPDESIADFVLFDEEISHETAPVTRRGESGALITRLVLDPTFVQNRVLRFQELWETAVEARLGSDLREDRPPV
jgi:hypothetical protein